MERNTEPEAFVTAPGGRDAAKPFYLVVTQERPGVINFDAEVPSDFDTPEAARGYAEEQHRRYGVGSIILRCVKYDEIAPAPEDDDE